MNDVLLGWPWLGLAFALLFLAWLSLRPAAAPFRARFAEPSWLLWLPLPIYMLHQFEEHGVDLFGRHYHFQADLCAALGYADHFANCPATKLFIFAVNVGTVWIAGVVAGLCGPRRPLAAAGMIGLLAVNTLAHIVPFVRNGGAYNSGLLSAVVLFPPLVVLLFRTLLARGFFRPRDVALGIAIGIMMHAILLGSVISAGKGLLSQPALAVIQILNGFLPLGLSAIAKRELASR